MATVEMATLTGSNAIRGDAGGVRIPYVTEVILDFAEAATAKGSALAALDVIEVLNIPAGTLLISAGMQVVEAHTGTSIDTAFDLGITGGDTDAFVDGFDFDGASVGDFAAVAAGAAAGPWLYTADDTLDLLIQAMIGTTTGGKVRVWALMVDVSNNDSSPGLPALGS